MIPNEDTCKSILIGMAIGDALGVPVEFKGRAEIAKQPVVTMTGYGSHFVPVGTFSDDSSLAFCLAEGLIPEFSLKSIADNFLAWVDKGYWTAHGTVFDIGISTSRAIARLRKGIPPQLAGGTEISDNGNGSLMRILPLLIYIRDKPIGQRWELTRLVSSITHSHVRSVIACFTYLEFAREILSGKDKFDAYESVQNIVSFYLNELRIDYSEVMLFERLLKGKIHELSEEKIFSTGYVVHTLEASIWSLLVSDSYKSAVLRAVNLGSDTDTTGAVTGGLAGLLYGWQSIPKEWMNALARRNDIEDLACRLAGKENI